MKILSYSAILFLVLSACNSSSEKEIEDLKKENAELKKQLKAYDNAIVITNKNAHKYIGGLAYGSPKAKSNESFDIQTNLYLHNLPIEVKWKEDRENQSVTNRGQIVHTIKNSFPTAGLRTFSGNYTLIFPDGSEEDIPWRFQVEIE